MTSTPDVCEVIITAPDPEWLARFSTDLVADRLCAAAHTLVPIRSVYWWQGAMHDVSESRVALHTRRDLIPQIVDRTNRAHPYDVPCVAVVPIVDGNPEYLSWIVQETELPN